jgi:hypothetical protein
MSGFQKTTCSSGVPQCSIAKVLQSTSNYCSLEQNSQLTIQILKKKNVLSKSGRFGALLGLNFRFFFSSLWPLEGSRRPNRAAVTPIGQQNPPGPLKLLGLREKTGKTTDF